MQYSKSLGKKIPLSKQKLLKLQIDIDNSKRNTNGSEGYSENRLQRGCEKQSPCEVNYKSGWAIAVGNSNKVDVDFAYILFQVLMENPGLESGRHFLAN